MKTRFPLLLLAVGAGLGAAGPANLAAAPAAPPHRIVIVSGEYEYSSVLTLGALSAELQHTPGVEVTFLSRAASEDIPGLDALAHADLLITFIRRMTLPPEQLNRFRDYLQAGHPLVAVRTSCHAFQNWKDFDHEVLGGNYQDHYPKDALVHIDPAQRDSPLLAGVPAEYTSHDSLYRLQPLAADTTLLMYGTLADDPKAREPMTWTRTYHGGRIFFTSLGAVYDFRHEPFMRLLSNAIAWALQDAALADSLRLAPIPPLPIHAVTRAEFPHYLGFSSYTVLDIRPPADFAHKHEKKAVNLDPQAADFAARIAQLDQRHNYVLCGPSAAATEAVATQLHDQGFPVVHYLAAPYTE